MTEKNSQHVLSLRVKDTLCIKALELYPDGKPVIIGGKNGSGKSASLQAIRMLLAGGREIPETVVRRGAKRSEASLETEDYVVQRTIGADGKQKFELRSKAAGGEKLKKPQSVLDALRGKAAFDPLAFARADKPEQLRIMRELAGVDTTEVDARIAAAEEQRAATTRELRGVQSELAASPYTPGVGDDEQSVSELVQQLEAARDVNRENAVQRERLEELRRESAALAQEILDIETTLRQKQWARHDLINRGKYLACDVAELQDADTDAISKKLEAIEITNKQARENARHVVLTTRFEMMADKHQQLTQQVEALRTERREMVAAASFPVDGLGFDDDGVTVDELPFSAASRGQQMRISAAIGIAEAKKHQLHVMLIDDADSLDDANLQAVIEMAIAAGVQPIIARRDGDCTVILEDGEAVAPQEGPESE